MWRQHAIHTEQRACSVSEKKARQLMALLCMHIVCLLSLTCGHVVSMPSGLASHCPSVAHVGQSFALSSQATVHTPHVAAHSAIIIAGFFTHSSSSAQMAHAVAFLSAQPPSALQVARPQDVGHVLSVWPGLLTHSPSFAQPGQSSWTSLQRPLHTPQVTGQFMFMKPGSAKANKRERAERIIKIA